MSRAGIHLRVERQRWLQQDGRVEGYEVQVTALKNKFAPPDQTATFTVSPHRQARACYKAGAMITCLRLPHFAAHLETRAHPELQGQPVVLVDKVQHPPQVYGVSAEAAQAGIRPGMPLAQAQAAVIPCASTRPPLLATVNRSNPCWKR